MVKKISEETKRKILEKSAYALPDRPSERGLPVSTIKEAFYKPILDEKASIVSEVNRIVDEINANEGNAELEELRNDIAALQESKQDVLVAGDGIKIEGNVISAIGGGGGSSGKKYVAEYDDETNILRVVFDSPVNSYDKLIDAVYEGGQYPIDSGYYDNMGMSSGYIMTEGDGLYLVAYLYDGDVIEDSLYEDCWRFTEEEDKDTSDYTVYYCDYDSDVIFYIRAPRGFERGDEIYDWLTEQGYTTKSNAYNVDQLYIGGYDEHYRAKVYISEGQFVFVDQVDDSRITELETINYIYDILNA